MNKLSYKMQPKGNNGGQQPNRREIDCKAFGLPNYSKRSITINPKGNLFESN